MHINMTGDIICTMYDVHGCVTYPVSQMYNRILLGVVTMWCVHVLLSVTVTKNFDHQNLKIIDRFVHIV